MKKILLLALGFGSTILSSAEASSVNVTAVTMRLGPNCVGPAYSNCVNTAASTLVGRGVYISIRDKYGTDLNRALDDFGLNHAFNTGRDQYMTAAERHTWSANLPNRVIYNLPNFTVDLDDSLDWLAIQGAISRSQALGIDHVVIPSTNFDYIVNQPIHLRSGLTLEWEAAPNGERGSYVRFGLENGPDPSGTGHVGTIFSNYNPFYAIPTLPVGIVQNVSIINPRVDGGRVLGYLGENAISFARAAKDITITGGLIRNVTFDPVRQGGRAVQCEVGCENLSITGLKIYNSSFGISSGVRHGERNKVYSLPDGTKLRQSVIMASDIYMNNVDVPVPVLNDYPTDAAQQSSYPAFTEPFQDIIDEGSQNQSVTIADAQIVSSGSLVNTAIPNKDSAKFGSCSQGVYESYFDRLAGDYHSAKAGGIFFLHGGRNLNVTNVTVDNRNYDQAVGGLVRGGWFKNIYLSNVDYWMATGPWIEAVFNFTSGANGYTGNFVAENAVFDIVRVYAPAHYTGPKQLVRFTPPTASVSSSGSCVNAGVGTKYRNLQLKDIRLNKAPVALYSSTAPNYALYTNTSISHRIFMLDLGATYTGSLQQIDAAFP